MTKKHNKKVGVPANTTAQVPASASASPNAEDSPEVKLDADVESLIVAFGLAGPTQPATTKESHGAHWLSSLTEEEQEQERAKQQKREEKALREKEKQELELQRRAYQEAMQKKTQIRDARLVAKQDKYWQSLEDWQEHDGQGNIRCKACNKMCDGIHEATTEHRRRLENYKWFQTAAEKAYPAPQQEWLAWVECESEGPGRFLMCLMCNKWVNDWDQTSRSTVGYCGHHGNFNESGNQKKHRTKLGSITEHRQWLREEKSKWHPEVLEESLALASVASEAAHDACPPSRFCLAGKSQPPPPPLHPPPPRLPQGWKAAWSEAHRSYYYYEVDGDGPSQWELPTETPASEDLLV